MLCKVKREISSFIIQELFVFKKNLNFLTNIHTNISIKAIIK